jgi:hypothetical protein
LHRFSLSFAKLFFSATATPVTVTTSSRSFCPSTWIIIHVAPLVQLSHWAGPVLAHLVGWVRSSPSLKLKRRRRICWADFGPTVLGWYQPLYFLG